MTQWDVIFLGPPGSGKGTQAKKLAADRGYQHLSTGDMLRAEMRAETPLGKEIARYVEAGGLGPDHLMVDLVDGAIQRFAAKPLLFDGYPRNVGQAHEVERMFQRHGRTLGGAIYFEIVAEDVVQRLSARQTCAQCSTTYSAEYPPSVAGICDQCGGKELVRRADDAPEVIRERLAVYEKQTRPLLDFYREKGILFTIDATKSVAEIYTAICEVLGKMISLDVSDNRR